MQETLARWRRALPGKPLTCEGEWPREGPDGLACQWGRQVAIGHHASKRCNAPDRVERVESLGGSVRCQ